MLYTFPPPTADVTFLILQTFSSHHTPCPITVDVAILVLHTFSSHYTTFSSYCRCDHPGTAQFLSSYCRCDSPFIAGFLITPHTLSHTLYCRCNPSDRCCTLSPHTAQHSACNADATLLVLHSSLLVLQM